MRLKVLSLLLLLSVLFTVSCQNNDVSTTSTTEGTETTTRPSEVPAVSLNPAEFKLEPGTLYLDNINGTGDSLIKFSFDGFSGMAQLPRELQWNWSDSYISYVEENVPDILLCLNGEEFRGSYARTSSVIMGQGTVDFSRVYIVEGYGNVHYNLEHGYLTGIYFSSGDQVDQNPPAEKLTKEECRAIAQAYINDYIATYAPEIDLSEYTWRETDLGGGNNAVPHYIFAYRKYLESGPRLGRTYYLSCGVSEYGSVVFFRREDDYSELEKRADQIDFEAYYSRLRIIADEILEQKNEGEYTYEIDKGYIQKLRDGSFLYYCKIYFYLNGNTNKWPVTLTFVALV